MQSKDFGCQVVIEVTKQADRLVEFDYIRLNPSR